MKLVGNIVEKKRIIEDLYFVRIKIPSPLIFIPGQFMSIEVGEGTRRSYSLSSLPGEEHLETYVDCSPKGPGSKYFLRVKNGDDINLLAPLGQFLYTEQSSPVHFFATGTGIVPFISMIRYALEVLHTKRKITLHLGAKTEEELIGNELWSDYVDRFDNFQYLPHVTRSSSWMGEHTRILSDVWMVKESEDVYICGGKDMVQDVVGLLLKAGISKENIYYERYN